MPRSLANASRIVIDLAVLCAAYALSFLIRFDGLPPSEHIVRLLFTFPYVVGVEYLVLRRFGVHRFVWRYTGLREVVRILAACLLCAGVFAIWRFAVAALGVDPLRSALIPYGVIVINCGLQFLGIGGVRVLRRLQGERRETGQRRPEGAAAAKRIMLVGAGQAGVLVARELAQRPDLGLKPVGFLDDDINKLGMVIHGIPVVGNTAELAEMCARLRAEEVLITIANAPGSAIRRIRRLAEDAETQAKIIPGLYEIVGGQVNLSRIRDIAIEDLLGRDPVDLDLEGIGEQVSGQVVLVTGAGGSIGSELCRQLSRFDPALLVLVERAENNLFQIHRELSDAYPNARLEPCIADVTDRARMQEVFDTHQPAVVFHAAAHKHVPMMEWNPGEAVKNNVLGTQMVADLADRAGVRAFVMISTDKAVNPSSIMGASKRAAEIYVQALSERSKTRFVTVRFGNVLGSTGSVIPIFKEQISKGGPVTVTHPEMRRYFMTIPEACQLVLQAASMGAGGEIFVLDMGEPVRIVDLARDLIALSGLREGEDIEIAFSGIRPGEKLFEELTADSEEADKTRHPKIFVGRIARSAYADVSAAFERLREVVAGRRWSELVPTLQTIVPELSGVRVDVSGKGSESPVSSQPRLERLITQERGATVRPVD
jgi:FlaA1/EpsC-like NDP-sugar epimerase